MSENSTLTIGMLAEVELKPATITENAIAILLVTAQRGAIHKLQDLIGSLEIPIEKNASDYLESEITRLELLAGTFERRYKAELESRPPAPRKRSRFTIDMFEQPKGAAVDA